MSSEPTKEALEKMLEQGGYSPMKQGYADTNAFCVGSQVDVCKYVHGKAGLYTVRYVFHDVLSIQRFFGSYAQEYLGYRAVHE